MRETHHVDSTLQPSDGAFEACCLTVCLYQVPERCSVVSDYPENDEQKQRQKRRIVYHESGHAVLAHSLGIPLCGYTIHREKVPAGWESWEGGVSVCEKPKPCNSKVIRIAFVGALAEAKSEFIHSLGCINDSSVCFCPTDDFAKLISGIMNSDEDSKIGTISFRDKDKERTIHRDVHSLSGDLDKLRRMGIELTQDSLSESLRSVTEWLDVRANWKAVSDLAWKIMSMKPRPVERLRLDGEYITSLVDRAMRGRL